MPINREVLIDAPETATTPPKGVLLDPAWYTSLLGIMNAMLGAGMLSYPFAFAGADECLGGQHIQ